MNAYSSFLFAEPGFLEGAARVIDWRGLLNEYNRSPSAEVADFLAIRSDWIAVGSDLVCAIDKYEYQHSKKPGAEGVEAE